MDHKESFREEVVRTLLEKSHNNGLLISGFGRFMLQAALEPQQHSREAAEVFENLLGVNERFGIIPRVKKLKEDSTQMSQALQRRFDTDDNRPDWLNIVMGEVSDLSEICTSMDDAFAAEEAASRADWPQRGMSSSSTAKRNDY